MGLLTKTQRSYYEGSNYGDYQFITISDVINNFMISHVGRDKILNRVDRTDVAFHAQRALQELSYDTLKSVKTQEIEVCANLKMPLPHDYVNYVKLTRVDSAGIEHLIYPTSKTSNPFSIEQVQDDCDDCDDVAGTYQYKEGRLKPQEIDCGTEDITCTFSTTNLDSSSHKGANQVGQYIAANLGTFNTPALRQAYWEKWFDHVDEYCLCLQKSGSEDNCGEQLVWDNFDGGYTTGVWGSVNVTVQINSNAGWAGLRYPISNANLSRDNAVSGSWADITNTVTLTTPSSNAWDNYKGATPSENQDDYQDDTYWPNAGRRYGLDPQHAHANGSFFIDNLRGMIHFSSNISGKTIILKYISDGLNQRPASRTPKGRGGSTKNGEVKYGVNLSETPGMGDAFDRGDAILHKFAEEAMYKWIAYGILSTRTNTPEHVVQRFKKEKFAETRKAKLRLSNIKLEEITQVLRGKSKHIKH